MNQRKAGTILTYIYIFVSNTISIFYTPYALQIMGQNEYGLFGTASSFISYLSILNFGIGGAYIRFNAKCRAENDREGEKRLNGMFLTVFSILAILVLIGGSVCVLLVGKLVSNTFTELEIVKLRIIMILLIVNLMITFIFNVVTMALQAYEKYIFIRIVTLVVSLVTPVVNIIALNMGGRAIAISAISLSLSILSYLLYFAYARKAIKLQFAFNGFRKDVMLQIFTFSGYLFLNSITDQITGSTDSIILSATKGTAAVAVYTIGANFKSYFQQFSQAVSGCFAPMLNMMVAKNVEINDLDEVFKRVGRIQFYVISLIFCTLVIGCIIYNLNKQIKHGVKDIRIITKSVENEMFSNEDIEKAREVFERNDALSKKNPIAKELIVEDLQREFGQNKGSRIFEYLRIENIIKKKSNKYYFSEKAQNSPYYRYEFTNVKIFIIVLIIAVAIAALMYFTKTYPGNSENANTLVEEEITPGEVISSYTIENTDITLNFEEDMIKLSEDQIAEYYGKPYAAAYDAIITSEDFEKMIMIIIYYKI